MIQIDLRHLSETTRTAHMRELTQDLIVPLDVEREDARNLYASVSDDVFAGGDDDPEVDALMDKAREALTQCDAWHDDIQWAWSHAHAAPLTFDRVEAMEDAWEAALAAAPRVREEARLATRYAHAARRALWGTA